MSNTKIKSSISYCRAHKRIKRECKNGWKVVKDSEKLLTGARLYESKAAVCHSVISGLFLFTATLTYGVFAKAQNFLSHLFRFSPSSLITFADKRVPVTEAIRILSLMGWGKGGLEPIFCLRALRKRKMRSCGSW